MDNATLTAAVHSAMLPYARKGPNSRSIFTRSDDDTAFLVVTVSRKSAAFGSLLVLIEGETVIIERDQNDKPLVEALLAAGVPRAQIILAYAGEPVPEVV
jgi:hypothetical protein